ncbi:MAG: ATP-binding protein, partial [Candidatus Cloacimonadota bacterium]|nr:ATP-binding protein [Candidatus Cloacimonadota bacterium]
TLGSDIYIIESGVVEVYKEIGGKKKNTIVSLNELTAGDFFGEMAIFDEKVRSASIKAIAVTKLYCLSKKLFFEICDENQEVLIELFKLMTLRFRGFNDQYTKLWNEVKEEKKHNAIGTATNKIIHDLKAPLTAISLSAELLQNGSKNFDRNLKRIRLQTTHAHEMVMNILELAKEPERIINNEKVDLNELFEIISSLLEPQLQEHNVKFQITHKGENLIEIDSLNIRRALMNILLNGIEAIADSGEISFESEVNQGFWKIKISDNGPGIPPEILPKIFDPFFSMGKTNGTGFGLAITQKIISLHNGTLKVGNNKEKGAYFEIEIPC